MNARLDQIEADAQTVEWLRLELERFQSELHEYRLRMGELEQVEALLAGENRLLELLAKGESLASILDGICRLVEETSSGSLCSILLLDSNGDRLWHGAAPSLPASYISAFGGRVIGPRSGPCGRAVYFKTPVIVSDIAADPLGEEYRDLALAHGLRACWSTPIFSSEGKVLGSFAVLAREPRSPTSQHQRIIAQITHLAAVAIERKRTETALRESEERFRRMADTIPEVIWFTGLEPEKVLYVSPSFERIWGFKVEELYANPRLWTETIHPEDRERVTDTFSRWIAGEDVNYHNIEYRIVQPGGAIRWIHERGVLSLNESGKPGLASGISTDITERKQAAEALHASEKLARGQVEALKSALDALAKESTPDRLVEHILRTLTEKFEAHSSSVWLRDEAKGMIGFEFAFEDGRIVTKTDSRFAGMDLWLPMEDFWPWPDVFRTGKASVIEDIREVRPFALRDRLLPLGIVTVLLIPMSVVGRLEGAIGLRFTQKRGFRPEEIELAQALANQAMLAMQLIRLSAESRESAVIGERNRMARDIHDTLAQGFTGVIMQLEAVKGAIAQNDLAQATDRVERAGDLARVGLGEARRSVLALRPRSLQDTSLCMALDDLLKRMTDGSSLQAEFHLEGDEPAMPAEWEEGLLRIAQESLTNTIKHAKARNFRATLTFGSEEIQFRLVDDGCGFDLHAEHEGFGLLGMKERVDQMGGQFILRSMPAQGTEIQVILNNPTKAKLDNGGEHA